jgi:hypothetical protein
MIKPDPERLLAGAKALALHCGDQWADLDAAARAHYQKEAASVVTALAIYDSKERGRLIKEGHAKARKAGMRRPGRSHIGANLETKAREMISQQATTRAIRAATGLGNSTISRIKASMGNDHVPSLDPASARRAADNVQI